MKVIVISEECHGYIGLATNYKAAIDFLVDEKWMSTDIEIYDETIDNFRHLSEVFADFRHYFKNEMTMEDFNNFWDGTFYLEAVEVHGTNPTE